MDKAEIDTDRIDDAVLALLYLTAHGADRFSGQARPWKTFSWKAMDRLYEKDLIGDPASKAKSVVLTPEGLKRSEALFFELFCKRGPAV
jgi:hypothetical protein